MLATNGVLVSCNTFSGWSDHFAVVGQLELMAPAARRLESFEIRSMKNINPDKFLADLREVPWSVVETFDDIDDRFSLFWTLFEDVVNVHAPLKTIKKKRSTDKPWMTGEIRRLITARNLIRREIRPSLSHDNTLKQANKDIRQRIKRAKTDHFVESIEENQSNPKKLWQILNDATHYKDKKSSTPIINSDEDAQDAINYFVDIPRVVSSDLAKQSQLLGLQPNSPTYQPYNGPAFQFEAIDESYVIKYFNSLSPAKATGIDQISIRIIKLALPVIGLPIVSLLNYMVASAKFPSNLKIARISLVHKGGDKEDIKNYRPISILSAISKVFEKVIVDQLTTHAETGKLFDKHQSAYRRYHSTNTALVQMTDSWAKAVDKGLLTGVLAIDLTKAFDCVSQAAIIEVLEKHFGVSGSSRNLINSYLKDRKAAIICNGFKSETRELLDGVPQGSILGPVLFIAAINQIKAALPSDISHHVYADDTTIWCSAKSTEQIKTSLEVAGKKLFEFFSNLGLKINAKKTQLMYVGSKYKIQQEINQPVEFLNEIINPSKNLKILGVNIDQTLSFDDHAKDIIRKCTQRIRFLWRTASNLPEKCKGLLYNALVAPHLNYCDTVWTLSLKASFRKKIETIQNNGARFIKGASQRSSASALRRDLGWLPQEDKRKIHYSSLVWQGLYGNCPSYIKDMIVDTHNVHNYNTRRRVNVPMRNRCSPASFSLRAPAYFNELPAGVRQAATLSSFRTRMLHYLREEN